MKKVLSSERKPIKMWLDDIEEGALAQAKNLSNLPFLFKHVALMPDCHQGYGMPIGGVIAAENVIIPNAVGVDIGCGVCAVKTNLTEITVDEIKTIMGIIRNLVPVGMKHHSKKQDINWMPDSTNLPEDFIVVKEFESAQKQVGTLGGGNHFWEVQKGDDGHIWVMIHSGSRNLGYKVAKHYNAIAVAENEKWYSQVPKAHELAFLPESSTYYHKYLTEMQYCVDFALSNRRLMMYNTQIAFGKVLPHTIFEPMINIAHNYARLENHFGKNVMVHRKGATSAREGEVGIIPGSQGTCSYIVQGLGNRDSFMSCSHGAGRVLGRKQAKKILDLETEKKHLDELGVVHSIRTVDDLDEATGAYKDIDVVMKNQEDLVEILIKLTPLGVIKG